MVVVLTTSATVVVEGRTHMKFFAPAPVIMHISSGNMQGLGLQGERDTLQSMPVKPDGHSQMNAPKRRLTHVALFSQGFGSQSSISMEQRSPVNPGRQLQVLVEFPSTHMAVPV